MRGISDIFTSRNVLSNKGNKGTGIDYYLLIRRKMYHQRSQVAVSSILCARNLKFTEHDNKAIIS